MNHGSTSQLKTIVILFVVLRVTILLMYTPQGLLNAYVDYQHYYRTAQFTDEGYYPFVNMWYEYPPVTTYLSIGVYRLTRSVLPPGDLDSFTYQVYARLLASVFLIFETGLLITLYRLAARAYGLSRANWVGWVYASLSVPLFFWNASQNSVVVWFALLSLLWLIEGRTKRSAVMLGLGIAAKFTPVFLLAVAAKVMWPRWRDVIKYAVLTALTVAVIYLPFVVLGGGAWIVASFMMLARLASYSTGWALIDGNWLPGDAGPLTNRIQLDAIDHLPGNPAVIPGVIVIAVFAIAYLWFARRPIDRDYIAPGGRYRLRHIHRCDLLVVVQGLESAMGDVDHSPHLVVVTGSTRPKLGVVIDGRGLRRMAAGRCPALAGAADRRDCGAHGDVDRVGVPDPKKNLRGCDTLGGLASYLSFKIIPTSTL